MNYGEKLKILREEKNISQYKLAEELGIKRSSYNQFENQYDIIPIIRLNQLANYFGVSIDYILELSHNKTHKNSNVNMDITLFKERLKNFRKENKLTQVKLAEILNTTQAVIANYERGRNFIATPFLFTICKTYHISADYLLGKTNAK